MNRQSYLSRDEPLISLIFPRQEWNTRRGGFLIFAAGSTECAFGGFTQDCECARLQVLKLIQADPSKTQDSKYLAITVILGSTFLFKNVATNELPLKIRRT